jgi:hypothetical protein
MKETDLNLVIENAEQPTKPPTFLIILVILTLLNTGLAFLGGVYSLVVGKPSEKEILESKVQMAKPIIELRKLEMDYFVDVFTKLEAINDAMYANFMMFNLLGIFIALIGAASALMMLFRMKLGFHAYIVYSFLSILSVYAFVAPVNVPSILILINTIFAGLFLFLYSRNLKWLTK